MTSRHMHIQRQADRHMHIQKTGRQTHIYIYIQRQTKEDCKTGTGSNKDIQTQSYNKDKKTQAHKKIDIGRYKYRKPQEDTKIDNTGRY